MSEAKIAAKAPIAIDLEEGKSYFWCTCGESSKQPLCDGSHKGSDFAPMKYTAEATKRAFFCACKQTSNGPLCDGAHKEL
ncbi:MAG: CDGSH iron-sulfur domain-containing protein [Alphaproteobacteria bacterium]|jgi:CDGSH-type Zn-finger protein